MISPPIEGLAALLEKSPIIPTFKARDLRDRPADVEAIYERHVRSFMPLSRGVGEEADGAAAYEQKLLRLIREAKAPLGYVAAEYGHGKTSTGLFLWERARGRNVLAVPPFSLDKLEDLILAVAGWVRAMVERVRPGLGADAEAIYERYHTEGLEALARRLAAQFERPYDDVLGELRALDAQGWLQTDADGLTYINFLDEMTQLALRAGYEGLLVVADEVQQYIEHPDVSSAAEPIGKLFDLITTMLSRTGRLACGLIFLLPNKELGLLNQQRGDLVQRIKANRLALDLTQLYGPGFATDLWERLAATFRFEDVKDAVIDAEALRALGEIAARTDLASGPRTVVNVLKLATERHRAGAATPYGVLDLVRSFEEGQVAFDGLSRVQAAVRQALAHELVQGRPERERAVRLMAAFPTTGLSKPMQEREGVVAVVDDLQRLAGGELIAIRGGGYDHTGTAIEWGVTLLALRPAQEQVTWLKSTIREFRRGYFLGSEAVHRLALEGLRALLIGRVFALPHWKLDQDFEATALSQNRGLLLRGAFPAAARRFPERVVHVRLLRPGEAPRDVLTPHDVLIDLALQVPHEADPATQRAPGAVRWQVPNHVRVELNLLHRAEEATYLELSPGFEDIVAPYDVNPLLVLSLYAHLVALLEAGRVPGAEESSVRDLFQPALLTAALRDLLNPELGRTGDPPVPAAEARFFETLVSLLCERTYSDQYVTLMVTAQWKKAIDEYRGALQKIDNPYIQNGTEPYEAMKKDLAALMTRTNATLDNFIASFPQLIQIQTPFRADIPGRVRFTLHPLEQRIVALVQRGEKAHRLHPRTGQAIETPTVTVAALQAGLVGVGYRPAEIQAGLELLDARRMIAWDQRMGTVALAEPEIPPLDLVRSGLVALQQRLATVRPVLSEAVAHGLEEQAGGIQRLLGTADRPPRGNDLLNAQRAIDRAIATLEQDLAQQRRALAQVAATFAGGAADEDLAAPLRQPVADRLVDGQLDALRERLLAGAEALARQGAAVRSAARAAGATLNTTDANDADLVQARRDLQEVASRQKTLVERREGLRQQLGNYRIAVQLLAQAAEFAAEKLSLFGERIAAQRAAFEEWRRGVREQLAAHDPGVLARVGVWQGRLTEIRQGVTAHEAGVREAFLERQRLLRALLVEHFGRRADQLPPPLSFNPADPEESERLLNGHVAAVLADARDQAVGQFERIAAMARDQGRAETLLALPAAEREAAAAEMGAVEQQAAALVSAVREGFDQLIDAVPTSSPAAVAERARPVIALTMPMAALFVRLRALTDRLQAIALTPGETRAAEALRTATDGALVDFGDFEQRLRQTLPDADPWALIRALVQKSRARVRIEAIRE